MSSTTDTEVKLCRTCGREFTEAQSSGKHCYPCKIHSIGWTWRGPTRATKQNFHDHTIAEIARESVAQSEAAGTAKDTVFSGKRWV